MITPATPVGASTPSSLGAPGTCAREAAPPSPISRVGAFERDLRSTISRTQTAYPGVARLRKPEASTKNSQPRSSAARPEWAVGTWAGPSQSAPVNTRDRGRADESLNRQRHSQAIFDICSRSLQPPNAHPLRACWALTGAAAQHLGTDAPSTM